MSYPRSPRERIGPPCPENSSSATRTLWLRNRNSAVIDATNRAVLVGEVLVWTFVVGAIFWGVGCGPLSDNNEGLYASIAVDMRRTGDFVIPRLAGMPYIEKPPLLYWLMALSFELFGKTAWSARLIPALAAFGTCAVMFEAMRWLGLRREARIFVLVFASSLGVVALAHLVLFDMLLVLGVSVALMGIFIWEVSGARSNTGLRVAAAGLGFGILAKGLVAAVLIVATTGIRVFLDRQLMGLWLRRGFDPPALGILLALVVPWHALAAWQQDDFGTFYFLNEQVLRFLGTREPHDFHEGPWYFYLPRLCLAMLPWVWMAPALLLAGADTAGGRLERFFLVWAGVPLLFFSLSQAKADYYIAVCLPPLAGWIACRLGQPHSLLQRRLAQSAAAVAVMNLLVVALLPNIVSHGSGRVTAAVGMLQDNGFLCFALAAAFVAAPALSAWAFVIGSRITATWLFAAQTLVLLVGITEAAHGGVRFYSSEPLALMARDICPGDRPLMIYGSPEAVSAVLFYWDFDFTVLDSHSADFDFASRHRTEKPQRFASSQTLQGWPNSCVIVPSVDAARFRGSKLASSLRPLARIDTAVLWGP